MTLIAFHTTKTSADVLTDTWAYLNDASQIARSSKTYPIQHLNAVYMTQGDCTFGGRAGLVFDGLARLSESFDALVEAAPANLGHAWMSVKMDHPGFKPFKSAVFLVGYSTGAESFQAWEMASAEGFAPRQIVGTFAMPSPLDARPGDAEADSLIASYSRLGGGPGEESAEDAAAMAEFCDALDLWRSLPPLARPNTEKDWVDLARRVRQQRALIDIRTGLKVFVAGELHLTKLQRGQVTTRTVHSFNDQGEELAQMVAGTMHPIALALPCLCGSGERFKDCCSARFSKQGWLSTTLVNR